MDAHELAGELGTGPLTRMIGLWVEQEPLLRSSSNRELALEVACLRLARCGPTARSWRASAQTSVTCSILAS